MVPPGSDQTLLVDRLANARYALDGKVLAAAHDVMALTDATLRLLMPGLPGGMRLQTQRHTWQTYRNLIS